jgi:hypothetical protein
LNVRYAIEMRCDTDTWYWSILDENNKVVEDSRRGYTARELLTAAEDAGAARRAWQYKAHAAG